MRSARTTGTRIGVALAVVLAAYAAATPVNAAAATAFAITASPATPGAPTASQPIKLAIRATVDAASNATPPAVRKLQIALPDGFTTTLPAIASCIAPDFDASGSAACPADSRLGTGSASFVYAAGAVRIAASTEEVVLFHGARRGATSGLHLYARIAKPIAFSFSIPGTIEDRPAPAGPLVTFDLSRVAQPDASTRVAVTRAAFDLDRGLVGGPCPAGLWTFAARLEYVGGGADESRAQAPCSSAPDTTRPSLRVSARDGRAASGARFSIRLSERAAVHIALERRSRGRWVSVQRLTVQARRGRSAVRIRRAGGRPLEPGRYRARLRAVDGVGLASRTRTVSLRLR